MTLHGRPNYGIVTLCASVGLWFPNQLQTEFAEVLLTLRLTQKVTRLTSGSEDHDPLVRTRRRQERQFGGPACRGLVPDPADELEVETFLATRRHVGPVASSILDDSLRDPPEADPAR